jgi:PAS domain S-box-containing protein
VDLESVQRGEILGSLTVAVLATDANGDVSYMNHAAEALTGRVLAKVLGRSAREFLTAEGPATGSLSSRFFIEKGGQRISVDCKRFVIRDREGKETGTAFLLVESDPQAAPITSPR